MIGWVPAIASTLGAWGGSISAGYNALFGNNDEENKRYQDALALQKEYAEKNIALQKEFAQHGVRWKIEDAKAAGIHPVAALGASGASYSPVSVGEPTPPRERSSSNIGDVLGSMGQNISRAVQAVASVSDRLDLEIKQQQLEGLKLDNALRGQRLGPPKTGQIGPAMPEEAPIHSDIAWSKTAGGGLAPIPSNAFAERAEDQWLPQIAWGVRNLIAPHDPADRGLGRGEVWAWNPFRFEFQRGKPGSFGWHVEAADAVRRYINKGTTYKERSNAEQSSWEKALRQSSPPAVRYRPPSPSWY